MMKCFVLFLSFAVAASADGNPGPFYRQGSIAYEVDDPVALKDFDFDLSGAIGDVQAFKTGLISQAWAIAQPAALFFLTAFAFYVLASLAFQLAYAVFSGKLTLLGGAWNWLASTLAGANAAVLEKFASAMPELEAEGKFGDAVRARRNAAFPSESQLLNLLRGVGEALAKYE